MTHQGPTQFVHHDSYIAMLPASASLLVVTPEDRAAKGYQDTRPECFSEAERHLIEAAEPESLERMCDSGKRYEDACGIEWLSRAGLAYATQKRDAARRHTKQRFAGIAPRTDINPKTGQSIADERAS